MNKWIVFLVLFAVALSSCKEVETVDPPQKQEETLADWLPGTWNLTAISQENGAVSVNGFPAGTFTGVGENITGSIVFTENPNNYTNAVNYTNKMTVIVGGTTNEQSVPVNSAGSGTWKLDANDNIELTSNTTQVFEVLESSSSRIKVTFPFSQTQSQNGITTSLTADVIAVYQK